MGKKKSLKAGRSKEEVCTRWVGPFGGTNGIVTWEMACQVIFNHIRGKGPRLWDGGGGTLQKWWGGDWFFLVNRRAGARKEGREPKTNGEEKKERAEKRKRYSGPINTKKVNFALHQKSLVQPLERI